MRLLVAALSALAAVSIAPAVSADTRDALSPWEGSRVVEGIQRTPIGGAPVRLKLDLSRTNDGHFRKLATTHLRGTVQRCALLDNLELCGSARPVTLRTANGKTELRLVKTRTMARLISVTETETYEVETGEEETIAEARADADGLTLIGDRVAAFAFTPPPPAAHGNMGQTAR